jgi:hypothetical protein
MKRRSVLFCAVTALAALALAAHTLGPSIAEGQPAPYAKPTAPTSPQTAATPNKAQGASSAGPRPTASVTYGMLPPEDVPDTRFDLPPLSKETIPTERSELPTADEWKSAPIIQVTRRSPLARWCRVYRVREYLKVHCGMPIAGLRQMAGSPKDVQLFVVTKSTANGSLTDAPNGGQVIFPLRKNDSRLFQFFEIFNDGWQWEPDPSVVVDASWPDGTDAPTVILR